jgi:copper chaperone CopZ
MRVKGVTNAVVDLKAATARVTYQAAATTPAKIADAISAAGFPAEVANR